MPTREQLLRQWANSRTTDNSTSQKTEQQKYEEQRMRDWKVVMERAQQKAMIEFNRDRDQRQFRNLERRYGIIGLGDNAALDWIDPDIADNLRDEFRNDFSENRYCIDTKRQFQIAEIYYYDSVKEALKDGLVTPEEAQEINEARKAAHEAAREYFRCVNSIIGFLGIGGGYYSSDRPFRYPSTEEEKKAAEIISRQSWEIDHLRPNSKIPRFNLEDYKKGIYGEGHSYYPKTP